MLFMVSAMYSQSTIKGQVVDAEGNPVPGVTIIEKGTTNGTITNADGKYTLSVGDDAVLTFSFVGYATMDFRAKDLKLFFVELDDSGFKARYWCCTSHENPHCAKKKETLEASHDADEKYTRY